MPKILLVIEGPKKESENTGSKFAERIEATIPNARVEVESVAPRNESAPLLSELTKVLTEARDKLGEYSVDVCVYYATNSAVFKNSQTGKELDGSIVHIACVEINNCGAVRCLLFGNDSLETVENKRLTKKIEEDSVQALRKLGIKETPFSRELVSSVADAIEKTNTTHH